MPCCLLFNKLFVPYLQSHMALHQCQLLKIICEMISLTFNWYSSSSLRTITCRFDPILNVRYGCLTEMSALIASVPHVGWKRKWLYVSSAEMVWRLREPRCKISLFWLLSWRHHLRWTRLMRYFINVFTNIQLGNILQYMNKYSHILPPALPSILIHYCSEVRKHS